MEMKTFKERSSQPRSFFRPERGKVSSLITAELSMIALSVLAWEPPSRSADIRSQVRSVKKV